MNDMGMEGREKKEKLLKRTKGAARFFHIDCQALRVGGGNKKSRLPVGDQVEPPGKCFKMVVVGGGKKG